MTRVFFDPVGTVKSVVGLIAGDKPSSNAGADARASARAKRKAREEARARARNRKGVGSTILTALGTTTAGIETNRPTLLS